MPEFDITPAHRASFSAFIKRQLFREPPAITRHEDADLSGKTAIVNGANSGLGYECCRQLLDLGLTRLIVAVRNENAGEEARQKMLQQVQGKDQNLVVEVWKLDLSSYDSITSFAERAKGLDRLDIVVNNAGVNKRTFRVNESTGHEESIQVNYLSMALATILLLAIFKDKKPSADAPGRMVIVSSDTAAWSGFYERNSKPLLAAFDKPDTYRPMNRYPTSKLLGQLFINRLAKLVPPSVAIINAPNPGLCRTGFGKEESDGFLLSLTATIFNSILARTPTVGARALTDAVVNHGADSHGQYLEDGKIQP